MADLDAPELEFERGCPDPGRREARLPFVLPDAGDGFDWRMRDFEAIRSAMIEQLRVRFPDRRRWTDGDLEIVLVDVLAAVLDQMSDTIDRIAAESFLETARRPESVLAWLSFIGLGTEQLARTPLAALRFQGAPVPEADLLEHWTDHPHEMEVLRRTGPTLIRTQRRMSSLGDYAEQMERHPLVSRARARRSWGGSWHQVWITVALWNDMRLDEPLAAGGAWLVPASRVAELLAFHAERGLRQPDVSRDETLRDVLGYYLAPYRTIGQQVFLRDVTPVGVELAFCVHVSAEYFQSEVRRDVRSALGRGEGGFFEPGRLRFGEDLRLSDFYERVMSLDGVTDVEPLRFKRVGSRYPDERDTLRMQPGEVAICDDDRLRPERGTLRVELTGGRRG